jgi:hypothetical protein
VRRGTITAPVVRMPTAPEILAGLTAIARNWFALAVLWHVVLAVALAAIATGWRPARRRASLLIALLPASAAIAAIAHGNPFNGVVLSATSAVLAILAARDPAEPAGGAPRWSAWAGLAMIAFGWVYPHFLDGHALVYLYAAPVGLVPCPTLSVAIGFALVAGPANRASGLTLAGIGGFYALFGAARLGVTLDLGLLLGAALLATAALRGAGATSRPPSRR